MDKSQLTLEHLHYAYFLKGWKLFVWRYFMKNVYPDWVQGYEEHWKLIREGCIGHIAGDNNICCNSSQHI